MKTTLAILILFALNATTARAVDGCAAEKAACEKAGYVPGGFKTKKGLWGDCLYPLAAKKSVTGVSVKMSQTCIDVVHKSEAENAAAAKKK